MMSARRIVCVIALLAGCSFCSSVSAQSFPGGPIDPGDGNATGGSSSAVVSGVPSFTSLTVSVVWAAPHTWVGDIILRLTSPDTVVTDLLVRAGKTSSSTGFGDSSNMLGTYTFDDSATTKIIIVANTGDTSFIVTPGSYRATTNTFNGNGSPDFTGEVEQTLNTLNGNVGNGTWTLFFSDSAGGDYAPVSEWSINFTGASVPEPSTWAMIGASIAGMGGIGYRQFRLKKRGVKTRFNRKRTKK